MLGSAAKLLAISSLCFSPPEKFLPPSKTGALYLPSRFMMALWIWASLQAKMTS